MHHFYHKSLIIRASAFHAGNDVGGVIIISNIILTDNVSPTTVTIIFCVSGFGDALSTVISLLHVATNASQLCRVVTVGLCPLTTKKIHRELPDSAQRNTIWRHIRVIFSRYANTGGRRFFRILMSRY